MPAQYLLFASTVSATRVDNQLSSMLCPCLKDDGLLMRWLRITSSQVPVAKRLLYGAKKHLRHFAVLCPVDNVVTFCLLQGHSRVERIRSVACTYASSA